VKKKLDEATTVSSQQGGLADDDLSARYEQLRSQILHGSDSELMAGLGVFLQQGMRAWMSYCRQYSAHVTAGVDSSAARMPIPSPLAAQIVSLMASMVLNHRGSVKTTARF
jgi:hypothetical protein